MLSIQIHCEDAVQQGDVMYDDVIYDEDDVMYDDVTTGLCSAYRYTAKTQYNKVTTNMMKNASHLSHHHTYYVTSSYILCHSTTR